MAPAKVRAPVPFLVIETGPEMAPLSERLPVPASVTAEPVPAVMAPAMAPPSWLMVVAPPRVIGAVSVAPTAMRSAPRFSALPAPTRLRPANVTEAGTRMVLPSSTVTVAPVPVKPLVLNLLEVAAPLTWTVPVKPARSPERKVFAAVATERSSLIRPAPVKALARVALPAAAVEKRAVAPAETATEPVPRAFAAENETVPAWISVPRE